MTTTILAKIVRHINETPNALAVSGYDIIQSRFRECTYRELGGMISEAITRIEDTVGGKKQVIGIHGQKTPETYAAVIAVLFSGHAFAILNPSHPKERIQKICQRAKISMILSNEGHSPSLEVDTEFKIPIVNLRNTFEQEKFTHQAKAAVDDLAYIMFTSGSTGVPKGVKISHGNLAAVMSSVIDFYPAKAEDHFSQLFELSFDLSLGEILWCFSSGGALFPLESLNLATLPNYLQKNKISIFGCAPSMLLSLYQSEILLEQKFPDVKYSLFCGENLPMKLAASWQAQSENSIVENLYGPTEASLYVSKFRLVESGIREKPHTVCSIGRPFGSNKIRIVDEGFMDCEANQVGEIILGGDQISCGYVDDEEQTNEKFRQFPDGEDELKMWYRTGDLGLKKSDGDFEIKGRVDSQFKIFGQRVESGEIESILNQTHASVNWVVVPFPRDENDRPTGIAAVSDQALDAAETSKILDNLNRILPVRMVPSSFFYLIKWPIDLNGKLDRKEIFNCLQKGKAIKIFPI